MPHLECNVPCQVKQFSFKDLSLGRLSVTKEYEEIKEGSESGKKNSMILELNETIYNKIILSTDVRTSSRKVIFNIDARDIVEKTESQCLSLLRQGKCLFMRGNVINQAKRVWTNKSHGEKI